MLLAMTLAAVLCILIGCQPQYLYALLPWEVDYWPYDTTHVLAQLQLLFFAALAFVWLNKVGLYPPELPSVNIDAEWLYRRLLPAGVRAAQKGLMPAWTGLNAALSGRANALAAFLSRHHGPSGLMARTWPTGSMAIWVAVLLAVFVVSYYL